MKIPFLNLEIKFDRRSAEEAEARSRLRQSQRAYKAAMINRLNADWPTLSRSARYESFRSLRRLRARVRHLAHNSDHMKKFLSLARNNIAGPHGMTLQVNGPDPAQNAAIETAWRAWSHQETASVNGRLSFAMATRKFANNLARDGEVDVRHAYPDKNPFGYALKFVSPTWLDEYHNETLAGGNRIVMGVELDKDDRHVKYWLTPPADEYALGFKPMITQRTPIDAAQMIHAFLPDDENNDDDTQTRGIPWAHTAMQRLFNLERYEEAALFAARAGASKMGFFYKPDSDDDEGEPDPDEREGQPLIDHFQPGTFWELPPGYEFKEFNPDFPSNDHDPFVKAMLRGAAVGLDVAAHSLSGDLSDVNFSSIRAGLQEEREIWKALQEFVIEVFCRPVFLNWLRAAILAGAVPVKARDFYLFTEPTFQPRRWGWVDPLKDVQAKLLAIGGGLATITDTLAETEGDRIEEVFERRRKELELAAAKGIPLKTDAGNTAPDNQDQANEEKPPAGKKTDAKK